MPGKPRINMRFREDVLNYVDAEVARRLSLGQPCDRTQLIEEACERVYGPNGERQRVSEPRLGKLNARPLVTVPRGKGAKR